MSTLILAGIALVVAVIGLLAFALCRISALSDARMPHPSEPPAGSLQAAVNELGEAADGLWREPGNVVPFPRRKPGGGWIGGDAA